MNVLSIHIIIVSLVTLLQGTQGFVPINDFGVSLRRAPSSHSNTNINYTNNKIKRCSLSSSSSSLSQLRMSSQDEDTNKNVVSKAKPEPTNKKQRNKKKSKNAKQSKKKKSNKKDNTIKNRTNNQTITNKMKNSAKNRKSSPNNQKKNKKKQKPYTSKKPKSSSSNNLNEKDFSSLVSQEDSSTTTKTTTTDDLFGRTLSPLTELKLGSQIEGYVAAFTDFGVFIKTDYDFKNKNTNGYGLLHKSQIRDEPVAVEDLTKLFRIGARVKGLRVININYAKGEVGLSLRKQRPKRKDWIKDIPLNENIEGVVSKVVSYGAFVDVGADVNALVHISRISQRKIRNIQQVIREGEKVTIHIISKDESKKTMAASMLDRDADEYLDRRTVQMKKMRESSNADFYELKSELEYFEDAVRELEEALGK